MKTSSKKTRTAPSAKLAKGKAKAVPDKKAAASKASGPKVIAKASVPATKASKVLPAKASKPQKSLKAPAQPAGKAAVKASAKAPVKNPAMLLENLRMAEVACAALQRSPVAHLIYISSDAVYKDSPQPLSEDSCAEPGSLHGIMHLAREVMLRSVHAGPLAVIRPTLVYGLEDPHNGYGPNRFRRLAAAGNEIVLFGQG